MEIITLHPGNPDRRAVSRAVDALLDGKLIIYPTDTHPALAADGLNAKAVERLCRLKQINPEKQSLTLVCDSISAAAQYARIDNVAFSIIKRNTPGPVTFILPPSPSMPKVYKGRKQVGIRIPDNPIALMLAEELGRPLLSGSLGTSDPTELDSSVELLLIDADAEFLDDVESSAIVELTNSSEPVILRESSRPLSL